MPVAVILNGASVDPEAASVSIFDRGFLYGDSVFEVLRTYAGVPFELELHLERLEASAALLGLEMPVRRDVLVDEIARAHAESEEPESALRVVITRGKSPHGLDPRGATGGTRIVVAQPIRRPPEPAYADGVAVRLVAGRARGASGVDPRAKSGNYLGSVLAQAEASAAGAHEALLLDARGQVTEGATSNVFAVFGGVLITPPVSAGILDGITRRMVLRLAAEGGRRALELPLTREALAEADEAFITSSIREILPICQIDDRVLGPPGPVTRELRQAFDALVGRV